MILTTIIYDDSDQPIDITGEYSPPCKGRRNHYGVPMEPDTEAEMTILDAVTADGDSVNLTKQEQARAIEQLWDALSASA